MNKRDLQKTQITQKKHYAKETFMKNLFGIILSILILCQLLCCFWACQTSTSSNETDDNNITSKQENSNLADGKETNSDLTDDSEKAYLYVKKAWDNSAAYTGAYTAKYSLKYGSYMESEKLSLDPQRKLYFYEYTDEDGYSCCKKILPSLSDTYHYYDDGYDGENFYFMTEPQADYQVFEEYKFKDVYLIGEMTDVIPNLSLADTLSELRAAYNEVISDACNSPESEILKATAKITPSVEKETYSLSIEMLIENKDGTKDSWKIEMLAQNHKLVKISFLVESEIEEQVEYIYAFDQIGYDAIEVQVPNVTTRCGIAKSINFYFKNSTLPVTERTYSSDNKITIETAYEEILSGSSFDLDNYIWYTDPQLTQPFDPASVSDEEWFALENLYAGEYTGNWIRIEYQCRHDVNEAYGIVMGLEPYSRSGFWGPSQLGNIYYTDLLYGEDKNKDMEIYLNGIKQAKGSQYFVADGSQAVYHVELVYKSSWLGW